MVSTENKELECLACGKCCEYMTITPLVPYDQNSDVREWLYFHGVELIDSPIAPHKALKFPLPCKLKNEDGKCLIYKNRPILCKKFPVGFIPECPHYKEALERKGGKDV